MLTTRRSAIQIGIGGVLASLSARWPRLSAQSIQADDQMDEQQRMQWWEDARFGLFLHWGLYSVAAGEWQGRPAKGAEHFMMYERIPLKEYAQFAKGLDLKDYEPDRWMALAKQAGMKYVVITAKHHEGFAMFDSPSNPYNIVKCSPYGKDPMKPLAAACRKYGIKLGFYYSLGRDWADPDVPTKKGNRSNTWDYPDEDAKVISKYFQRKVVPQVTELLTQYGPVGIMWFDTPELITQDESIQLKALIRRLQPACIINDRIGNHPHLGDYSIAEQSLSLKTPAGPWEACMTMSQNWGYSKYDKKYKTPEVLVRDLIEVASAGGNLLLDTGPTAQGTFTAPAIADLEAIGRWMAVNGEAIYGTQAWATQASLVHDEESVAGAATQKGTDGSTAGNVPAKDAVNDATLNSVVPDIRFTTKGDVVYVFARSWHDPRFTVDVFSRRGLTVQDVTLLGSKAPLKWTWDKGKLVVDLPHPPVAEIPIYTLRVATKRA